MLLSLLSLPTQLAPDTDAAAEAVPDGLVLADWLQAGAIFVGAVVLAAVVRRILARAMYRLPGGTTQLVGRAMSAVLVAVGFVYALSSIGVEVGLFLGALGIGGVALAFAFQDILENFMAGLILQAKRPFRRGSIVEVGEARHLGTVREIDSRSVIIDTFGGDRVVLPAAEVLKTPIINWTANGRRRLAITVGIPYRTEPHDAIDAITPRVARIDEVLPAPAPRVLLSDLADSAVTLTIYVWHDAFADIFWIQHRVIEEARAALGEAGIEIPFPQRVLHFAGDSDADSGLDLDLGKIAARTVRKADVSR